MSEGSDNDCFPESAPWQSEFCGGADGSGAVLCQPSGRKTFVSRLGTIPVFYAHTVPDIFTHKRPPPPPLVMNMTVLLFFIFYDLGYETPQSGDPLFYKYSAEETCGRILWTISSIFNNLCCHKISVCACVSALFAWMKKCEEVCCTDCMCCFFGLSSCFSSQLFS